MRRLLAPLPDGYVEALDELGLLDPRFFRDVFDGSLADTKAFVELLGLLPLATDEHVNVLRTVWGLSAQLADRQFQQLDKRLRSTEPAVHREVAAQKQKFQRTSALVAAWKCP